MSLPADDLNKLTLSQALNEIGQGNVSVVDFIHAYYDRIEVRESEVGAWHFLLSRERYLEQYQENREFYDASRLKGLPIGIKDIIDTALMPTEMGSQIHIGRQPQMDASCVRLLQDAGAIVPGKTVTTEFAYFKPGKTANPRNLECTPGGSSSGSAAAVADFMVPAALGSQTAASVIRPAAYCGVVGYVGSRGEYSLRGIQPLAQSLDSLGIMARSVDDIALLRSVLLHSEPLESVKVADKKPPRILVCSGSNVGETSPEMAEAMLRSTALLQGLGIEIVELDSCDLLKRLLTQHHHILAFEAFRNLNEEAQQLNKVSPAFRDLMLLGQELSYADYLYALDTVRKTGHWLWSNYADFDAILAPAASGAAPKGHDSTGQPHMSRPWQAMGLPVITLPGQVNSVGMPLGVQLIGKPRQDNELLHLAATLETCFKPS
jgi:Asp-tRNA(Asn)/Glu-tRNA(Gln) amidotransferase A subunit family amidase